MAGFKNRCLNILDSLYGFVSEKTYTSQLNLDVPITLVHDTSREAELGSGLGSEGGYFWRQFIQAIGAAATYRYRDDIYDSVENVYAWGVPVASQYRIWYVGPCLVDAPLAGAGDIATAAFSLEISDMQFATAATVYVPVAAFGALQAQVTDATAAVDRYVSIPGTATGDMPWNARPIMMPPGSVFGYRITSSAGIAGGVNVNALFWIGKKGTTPPGMR